MSRTYIQSAIHNPQSAIRYAHPASRIMYQVSKTCKSSQNPARNKNFIMQNKANFKNAQINTSTCNIISYGNFLTFFRPKNKAKQTQNEPNFSPKLALFFPKLASFHNRIFAFANNLNLCQSAKSAIKIESVKKAPLFKQGFHKNMINDRQRTCLLVPSILRYRKCSIESSALTFHQQQHITSLFSLFYLLFEIFGVFDLFLIDLHNQHTGFETLAFCL